MFHELLATDADPAFNSANSTVSSELHYCSCTAEIYKCNCTMLINGNCKIKYFYNTNECGIYSILDMEGNVRDPIFKLFITY